MTYPQGQQEQGLAKMTSMCSDTCLTSACCWPLMPLMPLSLSRR